MMNLRHLFFILFLSTSATVEGSDEFKLVSSYEEIWAFNDAELDLFWKDPFRTVEAYQIASEAEDLCYSLPNITTHRRNDVSDACRHFMWSALLYKRFGLEFASRVLNAHEQNPDQPVREKEMDLSNNKVGLTVARKLLNNNILDHDKFRYALLKSFEENLKRGNFVILK